MSDLTDSPRYVRAGQCRRFVDDRVRAAEARYLPVCLALAAGARIEDACRAHGLESRKVVQFLDNRGCAWPDLRGLADWEVAEAIRMTDGPQAPAPVATAQEIAALLHLARGGRLVNIARATMTDPARIAELAERIGADRLSRVTGGRREIEALLRGGLR